MKDTGETMANTEREEKKRDREREKKIRVREIGERKTTEKNERQRRAGGTKRRNYV